ncbi:hypothetical protein M422DRAFT_253402 [Sphaerobolus stellatus SS14]|uniref:Uncharacterized protein n=1 Tax=Sphaerobolus stellatus (strain SS14) TaxID=990650 RepID=A0A0C9VMT5_SPHS4|nr:hypothetical protein M422DRAFT_253402 [Sphaerobolus stellatus SS14]
MSRHTAKNPPGPTKDAPPGDHPPKFEGRSPPGYRGILRESRQSTPHEGRARRCQGAFTDSPAGPDATTPTKLSCRHSLQQEDKKNDAVAVDRSSRSAPLSSLPPIKESQAIQNDASFSIAQCLARDIEQAVERAMSGVTQRLTTL